jgi:hypothetical protein
MRRHLRTGVPFWPLGRLPRRNDEWLTLGIATEDVSQHGISVTVWRRQSLLEGGRESEGKVEGSQCSCIPPALTSVKRERYSQARSAWRAELLYPQGFEVSISLDWLEADSDTDPVLTAGLPPIDCARVFWIRP